MLTKKTNDMKIAKINISRVMKAFFFLVKPVK